MGNVEQETIRRVLAGDVDAYRVLMDRHFSVVVRMAFRVTGSMEDAEEAAQEGFLRAYNKLSGFREQAAFGTWVYRIAMNCALNLVERRSRDPGWNATRLDAVAEDGDGRAPRDLACARATPEVALLEIEALREQERLLACLTPRERSAFVLRHLEEQPVGEIAAALGITANTARQTIFRAASKLRRELAPLRANAPTNLSATQLVREPR